MRTKVLTKASIIEHAEIIIRDEGVAKCSMRRLAKEMGVGAGTLYNYYSNRSQLLGDVFDHSWEKTIIGSRQIIPETQDPMEGLKEFHSILRRDIRSRNGLGSEIITMGDKLEGEKATKLMTDLSKVIEALLMVTDIDELVRPKLARWILKILLDEIIAEEEEMTDSDWQMIGKLIL